MKVVLLVGVLLVGGGSLAMAAPRNSDPDWPCEQVKVSELSVGSFWAGPAVDPENADWQKDAAVAALVGAVTQRRLPIDQATGRIAAFAKSAGDKKQQELTLVFAGVFDVLNQERRTVIDGLDRFGARQKVLAANLRQEGEMLRAAQTSASPNEAKVGDLTKHLLWDQQFFETRRQSLRFACDVATIIEQRLYGLSQVIQQNMG